MATIAIGDIHGNLAALNDLLSQVRMEIADRDTVVFLGDYIDRGTDSRGCVEAILAFQREVRSEVVCLLGNHEDWLLRTVHDHARHSWLLGMEAFDTIRSYSADAERTLRDAVATAGAELYLGQCALPYEVFFDSVRPSTLDSSRVCGRTIEARIVCALTAGWIRAWPASTSSRVVP